MQTLAMCYWEGSALHYPMGGISHNTISSSLPFHCDLPCNHHAFNYVFYTANSDNISLWSCYVVKKAPLWDSSGPVVETGLYVSNSGGRSSIRLSGN